MAVAVEVVAVVPRIGAVDVAAIEVAVVCVCRTAGFVTTGVADFGLRIAKYAMAAPMTRTATIAIGTTGGFFAGVAAMAAGIAVGIDVGIAGAATTAADLSGFSSFAACGGSGACISIECAGVATLVARRCM
jgi:hypothetical protein